MGAILLAREEGRKKEKKKGKTKKEQSRRRWLAHFNKSLFWTADSSPRQRYMLGAVCGYIKRGYIYSAWEMAWSAKPRAHRARNCRKNGGDYGKPKMTINYSNLCRDTLFCFLIIAEVAFVMQKSVPEYGGAVYSIYRASCVLVPFSVYKHCV